MNIEKEKAKNLAIEMIENLYGLGNESVGSLNHEKCCGRRWVSGGKEHCIQVIPNTDNTCAAVFFAINNKLVVHFNASALGLMMISSAIDDLFYENKDMVQKAINAQIEAEKEMAKISQ